MKPYHLFSMCKSTMFLKKMQKNNPIFLPVAKKNANFALLILYLLLLNQQDMNKNINDQDLFLFS